MSFEFSSPDTTCVAIGETANATDILTKNTLTTAGVLVAGSAGVASLALVASAIPAQMALAAGTSAGLIYLGDRQSKDLPLNPFTKDEAPKADKPAEEAPAAA